VYVADTWNQRIQKLDPNLKVVGSWPVKGWAGQAATNKPYLAVDGQANLYATDPDRHRVLKFTTIGTIVAVWGQQGTDMSSLQFPLGIAADQNGSVLVVDDGNQRVLRFPG
jgi:DNA-binding beta-propeller fold protein YncE